MKKKLLILLCPLALCLSGVAQKVYDDFETNRHVSYPFVSGHFDVVTNTDTSILSINRSAKCGRYERKTPYIDYDEIKMVTDSTFNIRPYMGSNASQNFTMLIRTNDLTIGRKVLIQIGKRMLKSSTDASYDSSIYAQFDAATTKTGQWELLTFKWANTNAKFDTTLNSISKLNKIVLMYSPTDHANMNNDTMWFDNLAGPAFTGVADVAGINEKRNAAINSFEVYPNPASSQISVSYYLNAPANVSVKITDLLGREVKTGFEEKASMGQFTKTLSVEGLKPGIYYVSVRAGEELKTEKLVIK